MYIKKKNDLKDFEYRKLRSIAPQLALFRD